MIDCTKECAVLRTVTFFVMVIGGHGSSQVRGGLAIYCAVYLFFEREWH